MRDTIEVWPRDFQKDGFMEEDGFEIKYEPIMEELSIDLAWKGLLLILSTLPNMDNWRQY